MPAIYYYQGRPYVFDDGTSREDAAKQISAHVQTQMAAQRAADLDYVRATTNPIAQGFRRGMASFVPTLQDAGAAAAKALGATETGRSWDAAAQEGLRNAQERYPSHEYTWGENPLGKLGEMAGEAAPMIGSGVAATALGGPLGAAAGVGRGVGALAGLTGAMFPQHVGQNFGEYVNRQGYDNASAGAALGAAVPQTALDAVAGVGHLARGLAPRSLEALSDAALSKIGGQGAMRTGLAEAAKNVLREAPMQGAVGGAQEAMKFIAPYGMRALQDPGVQHQIGEAALSGGVLGGFVGGAARGAHGVFEPGKARAMSEQRAEARTVVEAARRAQEQQALLEQLAQQGQRQAPMPDDAAEALSGQGQSPSFDLNAGLAQLAQQRRAPETPSPTVDVLGATMPRGTDYGAAHDQLAAAAEAQRQAAAQQPGASSLFPELPPNIGPVRPAPGARGAEPTVDPRAMNQPGLFDAMTPAMQAQIDAANARNPGEFDALLQRARLEREAQANAVAEQARKAAEARPGAPLTPPEARSQAAYENNARALRETGMELLFPEHPPGERMPAEPPVDHTAGAVHDASQPTLPGVEPRFFDDGAVGSRADVMAPFEAAGIRHYDPTERMTPYQRAAAEFHDKVLNDPSLNLMDPHDRSMVLDELQRLRRIAENKDALATPDQTLALDNLTKQTAAMERGGANAVKAEETKAPAVNREGWIPSEDGRGRSKGKATEAADVGAPERNPNVLEATEAQRRAAADLWDSKRPPDVPKWDDLAKTEDGPERSLAPAAQERFALWAADNPGAPAPKVHQKMRQLRDMVGEPLTREELQAEHRDAEITRKRNGDLTESEKTEKANAKQQKQITGEKDRGTRTDRQIERWMRRDMKMPPEVEADTDTAGIVPEDGESRFSSSSPEKKENGGVPVIQHTGSAREVIGNLKQSLSRPSDRKLVERLEQVLGDHMDNIDVVTDSTARNAAMDLGVYEALPNGKAKVRIFKDAFSHNRVVETMLHELVHAATVHGIEKDAKFRAKVEALRQEALSLGLDKNNAHFKDALADPHEFAAKAMTQPEFRAALQTKPGLWQRFKNAVKAFLTGGNSDNRALLERVDSLLDGYKTESTYAPQPKRSEAPGKLNGATEAESWRRDEEFARKAIADAHKGARSKAMRVLEYLKGPALAAAYGSMDMHTIGKLLDRTKVLEKLGMDNPVTRILNTGHGRASMAEGFRVEFSDRSLKPLHEMRVADPKAFDKFAELHQLASIAQFDPSYTGKDAASLRDFAEKFSSPETVKHLEDLYNNLPPKAQALYREHSQKIMPDIHKRLTESLVETAKQALENLKANGADEAKLRAAAANVEKVKERIRAMGNIRPFSPLMRSGDFAVSYTTPKGEEGMRMFETRHDRDAFAQALAKTDANQIRMFDRHAMPEAFLEARDKSLGDISGMLDDIAIDAGFDKKSAEDILGAVKDGLAGLVADKSQIGRMIENSANRQNILGASSDLVASLEKYYSTTAHALASARYAGEYGRAFRDINKLGGATTMVKGDPAKGEVTIPADARETIKNITDEMNKRQAFILKPTNAKWANMAGRMGFSMFMGLNPSSMLMQYAQVPMVQLPVLAAKHGMAKSSEALFNAVNAVYMGKDSLNKFLTSGDAFRISQYNPEFLKDGKAIEGADAATKEYAQLRGSKNNADQAKAAFIDMIRQGAIGDSAALDLIGQGAAKYAGSRVAQGARHAERAISYMMQHAEGANRMVSGLAAWELAKGKSWDARVAEATDMVRQGHGDFSQFASPRWFQSNMGRVMLMFRKFAFHMYGQMVLNARDALSQNMSKRDRIEAAQKLFGTMAMAGALTGLSGLPAYGAAKSLYYLYQELFGNDEDTRQLGIALRKQMDDAGAGQTSRELIMGGLPTLLGLNLSSRLGYADMMFRDPEENADTKKIGSWIAETMFGPMLGMGQSMARGLDKINRGQVYDGIQDMIPVAGMRNMMKALGMAERGGVQTVRGDKIAETGALESLSQAVGFTPLDVSLQREVNSATKAIDERLNSHRRDLLALYRDSYARGDTSTMEKAESRIAAYNQTADRAGVPKMKITPEILAKSVKTMHANNANMANGVLYGKHSMAATEALRSLSPAD